jgi:hypothetical protein
MNGSVIIEPDDGGRAISIEGYAAICVITGQYVKIGRPCGRNIDAAGIISDNIESRDGRSGVYSQITTGITGKIYGFELEFVAYK